MNPELSFKHSSQRTSHCNGTMQPEAWRDLPEGLFQARFERGAAWKTNTPSAVLCLLDVKTFLCGA